MPAAGYNQDSVFATFYAWRYKWAGRERKLSAADRIDLYERMLGYLLDRINIYDAFVEIRKAYQTNNDPRAALYERIEESMRDGKKTAVALKNYIPEGEFFMLSAAEEGRFADGLESAIFILQKQKESRQGLAALAMPGFLIAAVTAMIYWFGTSIFPKFAMVSPPREWPASARALYDLGQVLEAYGPYILAAIGALIAIAIWSLPRWSGPARDRYMKNIPPYNLYRQFAGSGLLLSLASMMSAGIGLQEALLELKRSAGPFMKRHLEGMSLRVRQGRQEGEAISCELFSHETRINLTIFGKNSSFDQAMKQIGRRSVEETVVAVNKAGKLGNKIGLLAVGLTAMWVLGSIFELMNQLRASAGA